MEQSIRPGSSQSPWNTPTGAVCRLIPIVLYLGAIIYFASASSHSLFDFPLDDAWIHRVYARSFALGHGFQYNPAGVQEAGSTSPLWAILSAPAHWLAPFGTGTVVIAVKLIGITLMLVSITLVQRIADLTIGSRSAATFAAALFALDPRLHYSTLSGMETPLLLTLCLLAGYSLAVGKRGPAALASGLAFVTRPEAVLLLPIVILVLLTTGVRKARSRGLLRDTIVLLTPVALWGLFCRLVSGHWLPNTFYVKARAFHLGAAEFRTAWDAVTLHGYAVSSIFLLGLAACLVWCLLRKDNSARTMILYFLIGPVGYLFGVVGSRHMRLDGYYWTRWTDPAAMLLTVAFCVGYAALVVAGKGAPTAPFPLGADGVARVRYARMTLAVVGACALLLAFPSVAASFAERRTRFASDARAIRRINVEPGEWIRDHTEAGATIGVGDAGAIRYFGERRTIDLYGLNYAEIAFRSRSEAAIVAEVDWMAIFPDYFRGWQPLEPFLPVKVFEIPRDDYTICDCPGQTRKVIYRRSH